MNTMKKLGGVALLALTAPLAPALLAEEAATQQPAAELEKTDKSPFSVEVSLDVLSDYVWRGTICNGNPVWQPSVTAGLDLGDFGSIAGNVWQSYDLTHKRGTATNSRRSGGLQEIDYTLSYSVELAGVGFEVMKKMGISEVDTTGPKAEGYLMQRLVEEGGQLEAPTDYITLR